MLQVKMPAGFQKVSTTKNSSLRIYIFIACWDTNILDILGYIRKSLNLNLFVYFLGGMGGMSRTCGSYRARDRTHVTAAAQAAAVTTLDPYPTVPQESC